MGSLPFLVNRRLGCPWGSFPGFTFAELGAERGEISPDCWFRTPEFRHLIFALVSPLSSGATAGGGREETPL